MKLMAGGASKTQNDTRVLYAIRGIVQHCAHGSDVGHQDARHQLFEPILGDDLDVIVEKSDDLSIRHAYPAIVGARVVERLILV